jgi:type II secretory ATPase GspE/PulE/Tfp pilus assembly ATPase PilB-like protein
MGVPPFLVAYTVNIIVAQRLIRKICPHCKKEYILEGAALEELAKMFDIKKLTTLFKNNIKDFNISENYLSFFKGEGCTRCGQTGYKGRMGIYEVMEIDEGLVKKINERSPADEIKQYAREHGMLNMLEDALIKAKLGITSISEILRVTKE